MGGGLPPASMRGAAAGEVESDRGAEGVEEGVGEKGGVGLGESQGEGEEGAREVGGDKSPTGEEGASQGVGRGEEKTGGEGVGVNMEGGEERGETKGEQKEGGGSGYPLADMYVFYTVESMRAFSLLMAARVHKSTEGR